MSNKELYRQKVQAQLDEWHAEIDQLKARASGAGADLQLRLNRHIESLEARTAHGRAKLAELGESSDAAWDSVKDGFEGAWKSLRVSFKEARDKFKE